MNQQLQKYDYLVKYIEENLNNTLEDCSVFDFHKFSLEQNVDYLYFFVANCERVKYENDPDGPANIITKFETHDYEDFQTPYPFVINRYIPVVTPKYELRNVDRFYALGVIKVPVAYWKHNPAFNNYATLLQNFRDNPTNFQGIKFEDDMNSLQSMFTDATDTTTANTDFQHTVLINTHKGIVHNEVPYITSIAFADLDIFNHSAAMKFLQRSNDIYAIPTINPQNNKIVSGTSIRSIINRVMDNDASVYANNYGRIAHNTYYPYVYNFNQMTWYDWINFINNQYDGGILVTEYGKNTKRTYETYRMKYINTWKYPSMMFTVTPFTNMPKIVREDPKWNDLATVVDKVKYLKDNAKQIKYNWYNKNTLAYICCEHTRCAMLKHTYPKGLIIRNDGQEICRNCGEVIGNYNDDNAFVEGMDNIDADTTITYTWRPDQNEEEAKRSWEELSVLVDAVDPIFLSNIPLVNRFIQEYHNKDYYKRFAKYKTSPLKKNKQLFDRFLREIDQATANIVRSGKIESNKILEQYCIAIRTFINNNDIVDAVEEHTKQDISDIQMNVEALKNFYNGFTNDPTVKNLLFKAITTVQAVKALAKSCTKFFSFQYGTARRNNRRFDVASVTNFIRNVFKKSKRFYNLMMVMYTIAKVKSSTNNTQDITFDFNNIKWSAMFIHSKTEGYLINNSQSKTVLNLSSFDPDDKLGDFFVMNLKVNTEEEYYGNISIVNWINNLFATISQSEKQHINVAMIMSERKIRYNNNALNHQQQLIDYCYSQLNDVPLLNNVNNIITNKVIDSITCPDILTRRFNPKLSFKELLHSAFPSTEEYLDDKHKNNIMFNPVNKLFEYWHIDIISWIDENFIAPLTQYLRDNKAPSQKILEAKPNIDMPLTAFDNLRKMLITAKTEYDAKIFNIYSSIHLPNECQQVHEFIGRLKENIIVNINTLEKLQDELSLYPVNNRPIPNYTVTYGDLQQVKQTTYSKAYARTTKLIIEWYMLCLIADYNDFRFEKSYGGRCKSFNILKNSFDNFHTNILVNKIPYNIIKTPVHTFSELLNQIIDEMFKYNNTTGDLILSFLDNLRINTQLFVSPDNYTDAVVKTQRLINRVNNMSGINMDIQERELQDLDEEERGEGMVKQPVDNPDILTMAGIELEEVTQNEIMGEIEDVAIDEDMY